MDIPVLLTINTAYFEWGDPIETAQIVEICQVLVASLYGERRERIAIATEYDNSIDYGVKLEIKTQGLKNHAVLVANKIGELFGLTGHNVPASVSFTQDYVPDEADDYEDTESDQLWMKAGEREARKVLEPFIVVTAS